ncbi:MAG TPA: Rieske 2Fe-2S domain-containing protein [Dehalococcoidia bacterium]|nr:Rieske 2Fe-2S domain-containing protein [Dehalococcoidia bacterium]
MVLQSGSKVEDLVMERPDTFRIHSRAYTDPAIFELEMQQIFQRTWVYVAHETEIPSSGDYKTTTIGRQPVIVARGSDDNKIRVLLNRCRHRGATVCQMEQGSGNYFRCSYHGWVYTNSGALVGVPAEEGYGSDFQKPALGLVELPRVDSYRGFIFASFSPDGPSLSDHLGNAKPYIDRFIDLGPDGIEVKGGVGKGGYKGNWKFQMENTVDGYHFTFTHAAYLALISRRSGKPGATEGYTADLGNGHALLGVGLGADDHHRKSVSGLETRADLHYGPGYNLSIFPNLALLFAQVRVIRPISVDQTRVDIYPVRLNGVSEEVNRKRLTEHVDFYGPASFAQPDDVEMFARCHLGQGADAIPGSEWVLMSRGLQDEAADDDGVRLTKGLTESSQRAFHRQWRKLMAD